MDVFVERDLPIEMKENEIWKWLNDKPADKVFGVALLTKDEYEWLLKSGLTSKKQRCHDNFFPIATTRNDWKNSQPYCRQADFARVSPSLQDNMSQWMRELVIMEGSRVSKVELRVVKPKFREWNIVDEVDEEERKIVLYKSSIKGIGSYTEPTGLVEWDGDIWLVSPPVMAVSAKWIDDSVSETSKSFVYDIYFGKRHFNDEVDGPNRSFCFLARRANGFSQTDIEVVREKMEG